MSPSLRLPTSVEPLAAAVAPAGLSFEVMVIAVVVLAGAVVWMMLLLRRQAQELRMSEERRQVLFDRAPFGMVEHDYREAVAWLDRLRAEGVTDLASWLDAHPAELAAGMAKVRVVGANRVALRLVGTDSLEEAVAALPRVFAPGGIGVRRASFLALWTGHNATEGELAMRSLSGPVHPVYHRWWVPVVAGRPLFGRTQLALVDLMEIKSAERSLAVERERLRVTLRATTEAVVTADPAGIVRFMNDAASALTGWPINEAIGRHVAEVCRLVSEKDGGAVACPVGGALAADGVVDLPPYALLQPRTGAARRVEGRSAPMRDATGRAIGAVLVLRDIAERSRLEAELARASTLESVGVLAGGIAHDFNNLLSVVMGNLTLGLLDEKTAAAGGRWLREAERATMRARELTQQLLMFVKGGDPLRTAVQLAEVVREAAEFALHGATVRCEFGLAPDVRPADADKGQIGQVVQNLVINAVQAMPRGGVIRIGLRNETLAAGAGPPLPAGDYVRLDIADTGPGIAPDLLGHIFEPFFTTKELGSGLGLATVHSIVQKHRGHVSVKSAVGQGATFHVWLPAARLEPAASPVSASPFEPMRGRVLFMDDEEPIRLMTRALLEKLGFEATVTADGGEAVQQYNFARAGGRPFDLVILDLTVPGAMGGAEAMHEILKLDPNARGIVSSGYANDPVLANHRAHGFRGSVPKPYRIADFTRALREVMAGG